MFESGDIIFLCQCECHMVVWIDRGDGVWNGVTVPVIGFDLGNGDGGRCLLVEGNQIQRVVGCRVELVGEFGYSCIGLRFNDNMGGGVGGCEVVGDGVIEIYRVIPNAFYIVFGDGEGTCELLRLKMLICLIVFNS